MPKSELAAYRTFLAAHGVDPATAAMFEDIPHNLEPAHALGMTTVLVHSAADYDTPVQRRIRDWSQPPAHIHHMTDDLTGFLAAIEVAARAPTVANSR